MMRIIRGPSGQCTRHDVTYRLVGARITRLTKR